MIAAKECAVERWRREPRPVQQNHESRESEAAARVIR
jgi:hypothetical protein